MSVFFITQMIKDYNTFVVSKEIGLNDSICWTIALVTSVFTVSYKVSLLNKLIIIPKFNFIISEENACLHIIW